MLFKPVKNLTDEINYFSKMGTFIQDQAELKSRQLASLLAGFLCELLGHINKGKTTEGIEMTGLFLKKKLNFDIDEFVEMPADLVLINLQEKNFNNISLLKFADILLVVADELENQQHGNSKSRNIYEKCRGIYEYLNDTEPGYSLERQFKIASIKKVLEAGQ